MTHNITAVAHKDSKAQNRAGPGVGYVLDLLSELSIIAKVSGEGDLAHEIERVVKKFS